jgi:hypothetical protein
VKCHEDLSLGNKGTTQLTTCFAASVMCKLTQQLCLKDFQTLNEVMLLGNDFNIFNVVICGLENWCQVCALFTVTLVNNFNHVVRELFN